MSHDEMDFAEFFRASWDSCLRAVTELSFGTFQHTKTVETAIALITTSSNTCTTTAPTTLPTGGALLYYPA